VGEATDLNRLAFYASREHPCSYLDGRSAVSLFADPEATLSSEIYSQLIELGFRRSGEHLYRPHCPSCDACRSVRIPVTEYRPRRIDCRIIKLNSDIRVISRAAAFDAEHYALYAKYLQQRHPGGGMESGDEESYLSFLTSGWSETEFHEFRAGGELLAVAVTDRVEHGLSAVYTFFDPEQRSRSLGKYAIQWQLEACRARSLPYLYLGYWIKECQKMSYKGDYRPLHYFYRGGWHEQPE